MFTFPFGFMGAGALGVRLFVSTTTSNIIFEADPDTLADISGGGVSQPALPQGGGCVGNRFYFTTVTDIYERNLALNTTLNGPTAAPDTQSRGIGGTSTALYITGQNTDDFWEINKDTFAIINGPVSTPDVNTYGVGGTTTRLYSCAVNNNVYELNPSTLAVINGPVSIGNGAAGIGGTGDDRLYLSDIFGDNLFELNLDTLAVINGPVSSAILNPQGIGGTK